MLNACRGREFPVARDTEECLVAHMKEYCLERGGSSAAVSFSSHPAAVALCLNIWTSNPEKLSELWLTWQLTKPGVGTRHTRNA